MSDPVLGPFAGDFRFLPNDGTNCRGASTFANAPNGIVAMQFVLDRYFTINKFGLAVTTPDAGKFAYVGIYSAAGVLLSYGKFTLNSAVNFTVAASVVVTLPPGIYYVCVASDSTIAQAANYTASTALWSMIPGGVAANPIAAGAMPSTLGTITGPLTLNTATPVMLS